METFFERKVKFISKGFIGETPTRNRIERVARFEELDCTIKTQHLLHFKITALFKPRDADLDELRKMDEVKKRAYAIDDEVLYELTIKAINTLWIETPQFTAQDKLEFLLDSGALLDFGTWFLREKITPFFPELMLS